MVLLKMSIQHQPLTLLEVQRAAGATWQTSPDEDGVIMGFGRDSEALLALESGGVVWDRSHWGRIRVEDRDRLRFLHNQSTNDFQGLSPGQGCDTVFVTSTARTLDLATALIQNDHVTMIVSPNRRQFLMDWLDRYIFFADRVKLTDITSQTAMFSLLGSGSLALLTQLTTNDIGVSSYGHHQIITINEVAIQLVVGSGLGIPGYTLIMEPHQAPSVWQALTEIGAVPMGEQLWQYLRIKQGRPMAGSELTEDYNPLEAGLRQALSFSKGCYIGQETIARLETYKGVKQRLWGVRFTVGAQPLSGNAVMVGDEKVGYLTSVITTPTEVCGLAYIRTKAGGVGLEIKVNNEIGVVTHVPFLHH